MRFLPSLVVLILLKSNLRDIHVTAAPLVAVDEAPRQIGRHFQVLLKVVCSKFTTAKANSTCGDLVLGPGGLNSTDNLQTQLLHFYGFNPEIMPGCTNLIAGNFIPVRFKHILCHYRHCTASKLYGFPSVNQAHFVGAGGNSNSTARIVPSITDSLRPENTLPWPSITSSTNNSSNFSTPFTNTSGLLPDHFYCVRPTSINVYPANHSAYIQINATTINQ
ncbi:hypothetical protein B0H10DRAFT_1949097 [Mycena sp. CBHHK59/15]|nr:hypothetical protein B0H10DRAFT_1949097 [Mycena sp. CBHHK59/15]